MDHMSPTPKVLCLLGSPHGGRVRAESPLVSSMAQERPSSSVPLGDSSLPGAGWILMGPYVAGLLDLEGCKTPQWFPCLLLCPLPYPRSLRRPFCLRMAPGRLCGLACRVQNLEWGGVEEIHAWQAFHLVEENNTSGAYKLRFSCRP